MRVPATVATEVGITAATEAAIKAATEVVMMAEPGPGTEVVLVGAEVVARAREWEQGSEACCSIVAAPADAVEAAVQKSAAVAPVPIPRPSAVPSYIAPEPVEPVATVVAAAAEAEAEHTVAAARYPWTWINLDIFPVHKSSLVPRRSAHQSQRAPSRQRLARSDSG